MCHRCGKPGHFIRECPENGNAAFDGQPRVRHGVPGMPRTFWRAVDEADIDEAGSALRRGVVFRRAFETSFADEHHTKPRGAIDSVSDFESGGFAGSSRVAVRGARARARSFGGVRGRCFRR